MQRNQRCWQGSRQNHEGLDKVRRCARQSQSAPRAGFAIVVVLASLMVLTAIFAIASQRSMAHVLVQNAEQHLAKRQADNAAILTLLLHIEPDALAAGPITLPPPFEATLIDAQDVGGLIDLNTASPELLGLLFNALDFPPDATTVFSRWRQDGQRLLRVDDLIRITQADLTLLDQLLQIATVHSGRRGVNTEVAPESVKLIAGSSHETPASNTNFAIYLSDNRLQNLIGVISLVESQKQSRVLELR